MVRQRDLQLAVESASGWKGMSIEVYDDIVAAELILIGTHTTGSIANEYVVGNTRKVGGAETTRTFAPSSEYRGEKNIPQI